MSKEKSKTLQNVNDGKPRIWKNRPFKTSSMFQNFHNEWMMLLLKKKFVLFGFSHVRKTLFNRLHP